MKKQFNSILAISLVALSFAVLLTGCGGGPGQSEKAKLLMSKNWKLDPNATLKGSTDSIKGTTGVTADIQLKGDVGAIANFLSETLVFGQDQSDKSKLSYSKTYGEGLLSTSSVGFWELSKDESTVIMKPWDNTKGELPPVNYKIVELTADKLSLQKEGDVTPSFYFAK